MNRHYPYLIIGGGMAADAAVRGIRQMDQQQAIGLIGAEPDPPYNRPPLSKGLWKTGPRPMPLSRIWRRTETLGGEMHLGRTAVSLDPAAHTVLDDRGTLYSYQKLLLATGGDPIRLGPAHDRVIYYRTLADYHRLRALTDQGSRFAVIGGGFIGSEIAAALISIGKEVILIFPEEGICARVLPRDLSQHLNGLFHENGARVLSGHLVQDIHPGQQEVLVHTGQGETLRVDGVVAGLGIRANTRLAEAAGLQVSNGILADRALRTTHPDIFAAGDVVNFHNPALNMRMRVEHEENANLTGMLAGQGMAGEPGTYDTIPSVYSSLFDLHYDAVGILDPSLEIVYDWEEPFRKGRVFYRSGGQVRGVLLWNQNEGLEAARQQIGLPAG